MSKKETSEKIQKDTQKVQNDKLLSKDVTEEPQDKEHMHLKHIKHSPALVDVYLAVSDDKGGLLGDEDLEQKVKTFVEQYGDKNAEEIENPLVVLDELKKLYVQYSMEINKTDAISVGTVAKYRNRQGMLLNIEKKLLKKTQKQWIDYFAKAYGRKHLRSAQDYMALGGVPNIIRYAVYGKERLMEVIRAIKALNITGNDPVAVFLENYNISYNVEETVNDELLAELKIEIDAAIAMTKIKKVEQKNELELGIREDLIKSLIGLGIKIENGLIGEMIIVKKAKGEVNQHLENVYMNGIQGHPIVKPTKKVQGFPRLVSDFKITVEYVREHSDLVQSIDRDKLVELEQYVSELKSLIGNPQ